MIERNIENRIRVTFGDLRSDLTVRGEGNEEWISWLRREADRLVEAHPVVLCREIVWLPDRLVTKVVRDGVRDEDDKKGGEVEPKYHVEASEELVQD